MRNGRLTRTPCGLVLALALLTSAPALAADAREMQAREAYAAGRYQDALDLFVKLYAETLHPNYLRNIGRAYQNLDQPDRAISSFREYLRKARALSDRERAEIEGYIHEMEALKRGRAAVPPQASAPRASPALAAPPAIAIERAPVAPPIYKRWWFWTLLGTAVAGGTAALFASGVVGGTKDAPCNGRICR
jgi:tetratricopeptide (TPR) repeat protein